MCGSSQACVRVHPIQASIRIGGEQGRVGGFYRTAFETRTQACLFCCAHDAQQGDTHESASS